MKNLGIRERAAVKGVRLWQIADRIGINDGTFSRRLRKELPSEEQAEIMQIIEALSKEGI